MQLSREALSERVQDFLGTGRLRASEEHRRDEIILGICAMVVVTVVTITLGAIYLRPPGNVGYRAEFGNSSGVRSGDQVRVAGITVGRVDDVRIAGDRVAVKFSVSREVQLGDETSIAVKMLTPVGGRYLMVAPKGTRALADAVIPASRVTGTYDMSAIIEKATPKVEQLDGNKLREVLTAARKTMSGDTRAIGQIVDSAAHLLDELGQRAERLQGALKVADEYLSATTRDRTVLMNLVKSLADLGVGLGPRYDQVRRVFNDLGRFFAVIKRITTIYEAGFEKSVVEGSKLLERLRPNVDSIGDILQNVDGVLERLQKSLSATNGPTIDQSAQKTHGLRVCVPNAAKRC